jgi:glutamate 5-kinase
MNNNIWHNWQRIVLKVGSALIAPSGNGCSAHQLFPIAQFIIECRKQGKEVVLVSSGSVAAGRHVFSSPDNPTLEMKKAMAAAGQSEMVATWDRLFDFPTAQILLTHGDLRDQERYQSIRDTIEVSLNHGVMPIVNENDTVTTDMLKVGDNDNLSAMVAAASGADALIMCSDIAGLYNKNPNLNDDAELLCVVNNIDDSIMKMAGGAVSSTGTGGMLTKLQAAEKATAHGITTFIVNGFEAATFAKFVDGENPGTVFTPFKKPMQDELHWLTHTTRAQGELVVNQTGVNSVLDDEQTLSSDQLIDVKGNFNVGDTIMVKTENGTRVAKAVANYSSCLMSYIADSQEPQVGDSPKIDSLIEENNIALLQEA